MAPAPGWHQDLWGVALGPGRRVTQLGGACHHLAPELHYPSPPSLLQLTDSLFNQSALELPPEGGNSGAAQPVGARGGARGGAGRWRRRAGGGPGWPCWPWRWGSAGRAPSRPRSTSNASTRCPSRTRVSGEGGRWWHTVPGARCRCPVPVAGVRYQRCVWAAGVGSASSGLWDLLGNAMVMTQFIRLTPDVQSKQGAVWNRVVSGGHRGEGRERSGTGMGRGRESGTGTRMGQRNGRGQGLGWDRRGPGLGWDRDGVGSGQG